MSQPTLSFEIKALVSAAFDTLACQRRAVSVCESIYSPIHAFDTDYMKPQKNTGVWSYLKGSGVLDTGDDEAIAKAKSEYWRKVNREYKAARRKQNPEHILKFTSEEHGVIIQAANAYHLSPSEFIKQSALAYIAQRPLIPDTEIMRRIDASLTRSLTAIERIAQQEKKNWFIAASDFTELKTHIMHMRKEVQAIRAPNFLQPYNSAL